MKKMIFILLLLLTACSDEQKQAMTKAREHKEQFAELTNWSASCEILADYGDRVYEFVFLAEFGEDILKLEPVAPEELLGFTVSVGKNYSKLEYEGVILETGDLTATGLSPVSAVPYIFEMLTDNYISSCEREENALILRFSEENSGILTEITLDYESGAPMRAEIVEDGFSVFTCTFKDFTI